VLPCIISFVAVGWVGLQQMFSLTTFTHIGLANFVFVEHVVSQSIVSCA
jgi:hypothetical protein